MVASQVSEMTAQVTKGATYAPGRATMRALFHAAEQRFATDGYERTTVRSIARTADVPVGSLYQFYDNKNALLDAVVDDYTRELDSVFGAATDAVAHASAELTDVPELPGPAVRNAVGAIVDGVATLAGDRAAFRTLFIGSETSGPFDAAGQRLRASTRQHIFDMLDTTQHGDSDNSRQRTATICVEVIRGLLGSVVDTSGHIDTSIATELKTLLVLYVFHTKTTHTESAP